MKRLSLFALPLLVAAASAVSAQGGPGRLVGNTFYEARGAAPGWRLAIGDSIVLRMDPDAEGFAILQYFPRVRSRDVDRVQRWESRTPGGAIMVIEARREPCMLEGTRFRDSVIVVQGPRRLSGCGGPRLSNNPD